MRRTRKKDDSPRIAPKVAGAILGVLVGLGCAAVWLALKDVAIVNAPPKLPEGEKPARHEVYYLKGNEAPVRQSQWSRKHRAFLEQDANGIDLAEPDVNWWSNVEFGRLELSRKWDALDGEFRIGVPQFRIDGNRLHVGLVNKLSVLSNLSRELVVQAKGEFRKGDGRFAFVPEHMQIGALPIPFASLRRRVASFLSGAFPVSEEFARSWAAVDDIQVAEGRIRIGFERPLAVDSAETPGQVDSIVSQGSGSATSSTDIFDTPGQVVPADSGPESPAQELQVPLPGSAPSVAEPATSELVAAGTESNRDAVGDVAKSVDAPSAAAEELMPAPAETEKTPPPTP